MPPFNRTLQDIAHEWWGNFRQTIAMRPPGPLGPPPKLEGGGSGTRLGATTTSEPPLGNTLNELLQKGHTYADIARILGITRNAVAGRVRDLGLGSKYERSPQTNWSYQRTDRPRAPYASWLGRQQPSLPKFNLPPEEDIDPKELLEYLKTFGGR